MNKVTKTILWIVVVIIVVAGIWYGVSRNKMSVSKEPIKIGATLPLSGNFAFIGKNYLNGLTLAVEEINNKGGVGGKKIKLIIEDNKGDAKEAVTNVQKLISIDGVDFVFSAFTHITQAISPIMRENKKILFYASTLAKIAEDNPYAFRDYWDVEENMKLLLKSAINQGHKKIAILTEINDACKNGIDAMLKDVEKNSIDVVGWENYQSDTTDFKSYITKLSLDNADSLIMCSVKHREDMIMKQLKELGFINKVQAFILAAPFLPSGDTPEARKLYEENKTISTWYGFSSGGSLNKIQQEFIKNYKERYKEEPRSDAAYAYDDIYILSKAIEECRGDVQDTECILNRIKNTFYDGAGGFISFNQNGVSKREIFLIKVENGEWVKIN